jgi:hypothetical protein
MSRKTESSPFYPQPQVRRLALPSSARLIHPEVSRDGLLTSAIGQASSQAVSSISVNPP